MTRSISSLLGFLTIENPTVYPSYKPGKNTLNANWVTIEEIISFGEFNVVLALEHFGLVLRKELSSKDIE